MTSASVCLKNWELLYLYEIGIIFYNIFGKKNISNFGLNLVMGSEMIKVRW